MVRGKRAEQYSLPNGATVALSVVGSEADGIATLRSVGSSPDGSSVRVVLQDFDVEFGEVPFSLFADAALVTKTGLKTSSAKSYLIGLEDDDASWRFSATLSRAREGDFLQMDRDDDGADELYRVTAFDEDSGTFTLLERPGGTVGVPEVDGTLPVTLIPFGVGRPVGSVGTPPPYALADRPAKIMVTNGEVFTPGTQIRIAGIGGLDNIGEVTEDGWDPDTGELSVSWDCVGCTWTNGVAEGTPVRKLVLSAIAEGGCPTNDVEAKLPQGCEDSGDGVDLGDLWAETFGGLSKIELRDIANGDFEPLDYPEWTDVDGSYYTDGDWPEEVHGLTWIDGAQTRGKNNELCGSGIVVLNTGASLDELADDRINLTTADCDFTGILFVIGQLKLVGNLDNFSGAVFVEGPGGITEVQGNGDKALYDPIAIREALEALPPEIAFEGIFAALPSTWRISQLP